MGVYGMAHITGGGIPENLPRCLPEGVKAHVDWNAWSVPEIFLEIQRQGNVDESERCIKMSVKLTLLKSGETLISDVKEVVADINQDKPTAFILENPHLVDTRKKDGGKFDVILSPWLVLSKDTSMVIPTDWVDTTASH